MKADPKATASLLSLAYMGHGSGDCPYLDDREARLLYLDGAWVGSMYRTLIDLGFRRNGTHLYRPDCPACNECKVIRVPVDTFKKTKEQRRIWNRGHEVFTVRVAPAEYAEEKLALQRRYMLFQHGQTGEELPTERTYRAFLVDTCLGDRTREVQLWHEEKLVGLGIIDEFVDALSTVNFFFDPSVAKWSPGTFSALAEIELARQWGKSYYYLGYYIADCRTMNYKTRFRPNQVKNCSGPWPT